MNAKTGENLDKDVSGLLIYRSLLQEPLVRQVCNLFRLGGTGDEAKAVWQESCAVFISQLLDQEAELAAAGDNLWQNHLTRLVAGDSNVFSRSASRQGEADLAAASISRAAAADLEIIRRLFDFQLPEAEMAGLAGEVFRYQPAGFHGREGETAYHIEMRRLKRMMATAASGGEIVAGLAAFHRRHGCGKFARYPCFRWEEATGLTGIANPENAALSSLIGYQQQKETVVRNTESFLRGLPANNLLLYGDRGTGKSSTVKSLVREFAHLGLRLVEIQRHQLSRLMEAVREAQAEPQHFIFFIDDLSFEAWETEYKYLKALLEGGLEAIPDNVLIYATSNRRHLVQETWADRDPESGEIHPGDAMTEKLSLADRFGLTVTYTTPDQEEYLQIVEGLAEQMGIEISRQELRDKALQWERWYHGRSGRTARQFIHSLIGSMAGGESLIMAEILS